MTNVYINCSQIYETWKMLACVVCSQSCIQQSAFKHLAK